MKWKAIDNFPGYEISNTGKLKRHGKIIRSERSKNGYQRKYLKDFNKNVLIHRLVAKAFIPNPLMKSQVNHKDKNKENNNAENLEWATPSENQKHSYQNGREILSAENVGSAKLTNIQVQIIREAIKRGDMQKQIAKYFKLDPSTISRINTKSNWSSL